MTMNRVTRLRQVRLAISLFVVAGLCDASASGGGSSPAEPEAQIDQAFQQFRVGYLAGNVSKMEAAQARAVKGYVRILSKKGEDDADSVSVALIEKYSAFYPQAAAWVRSFFIGAKMNALDVLREAREKRRRATEEAREKRRRATEEARIERELALLYKAGVVLLQQGESVAAVEKFSQVITRAQDMGLAKLEEQAKLAYANAQAQAAEAHIRVGAYGKAMEALQASEKTSVELGRTDELKVLISKRDHWRDAYGWDPLLGDWDSWSDPFFGAVIRVEKAEGQPNAYFARLITPTETMIRFRFKENQVVWEGIVPEGHGLYRGRVSVKYLLAGNVSYELMPEPSAPDPIEFNLVISSDLVTNHFAFRASYDAVYGPGDTSRGVRGTFQEKRNWSRVK